MAGTVWEWCLNKFDRPEESGSRADNFDFRVLRGGSWLSNRDGARSAIRFRDYPNDRDYFIVFGWCVAHL
jgi:formylglycine-generating enzyme required for sulfatase activity